MDSREIIKAIIKEKIRIADGIISLFHEAVEEYRDEKRAGAASVSEEGQGSKTSGASKGVSAVKID
jgi:hypothetical protein